MSLPLRGAWIEIVAAVEEWEKVSRSPCGERGLKFVDEVLPGDSYKSLPLRGAWIEIC